MTSRDTGASAAVGLKILLICYEYPPLGGGGGVGAKKYAETWSRQGHDVTVLTGAGSGLPAQETVAGVRIYRVSIGDKPDRATTSLPYMAGYLVAGAWFLLRHRKRFNDIQVVNTHFVLPSGPLGWWAGHILRVPNVLTIIGGDVQDPTRQSSPDRHALLRWVNRFLMKAAGRLIAISSDTARRAREIYGITRPIDIINYGFDSRGRRAGGIAERNGGWEEEFRLVAVGRLVPRKGFDRMVNALAMLPDAIRLVIVGDGPEEPYLRERASQQGVAHRVHFTGFLSPEEVDEALRNSDCFVLSSLHEGLGIVVQEAMHAGLPIVSTNNGGQTDLVQHEWNGLLVPPDDPGALAEAILRVWRNPHLAEEMARRGREALQRLDLDQNAAEYVRIFRRCLGSVEGSGGGEREEAG